VKVKEDPGNNISDEPELLGQTWIEKLGRSEKRGTTRIHTSGRCRGIQGMDGRLGGTIPPTRSRFQKIGSKLILHSTILHFFGGQT